MSEHTTTPETNQATKSPRKVCVSNGTEFYEIAQSDLNSAKDDGFYIPEERGLFIVGNGVEIFEIQADDLPDALADGFVVVGENALYLSSVKQETAKTSRVPVPETPTGTSENTATETDDVESTNETSVPDTTEQHSPLDDVSDIVHIDAAPTEEELRREELRVAYKAANGKEKLLLGWQLYGPTWEGIRQRVGTFGISAVVHVIILLAMGLIVFTVQREQVPEIVSTISEVDSLDDAIDTNVDVDDLSDADADTEADAAEDQAASLLAASIPATPTLPSELDIMDFQTPDAPSGGVVEGTTQLTGSAQAARGAATAKYGGSPGSEEAVETGLDWLSRHQAEDGSWCFNHHVSVKCDCKSAGTHDGKTGATGLALLCYYGAGYTFAEGNYSDTISRGIQYLLKSMDISSGVYGDLRETPENPGIYQHGIAAAALCETLAMNLAIAEMQIKDPNLKLVDSKGRILTKTALRSNTQTLRRASELALSYIYHHQSPTTGGWGYKPKSAGDLSVTGWQVMAMASGENAQIPVPPSARAGVRKYLLTASKDNGASFAYTPARPPTPTMSAVGLMCSILNGAERTGTGLKSGMSKINTVGPDFANMYYTYYATQVLFGWGDEPGPDGEKYWTNWNRRLRDPLVARQIKTGHEKGSWPSGTSATTGPGGRHLETCMAILTLEIYYRKLPMLDRLSMKPIDLTNVKDSLDK